MNDPLLPDPLKEATPDQQPGADQSTVIPHNFESIADLSEETEARQTEATPLVVVHYRRRLGIGLILLSLLLGGETAYLVARARNPAGVLTAIEDPRTPTSRSANQKAKPSIEQAPKKPALVLEVRPLPVPEGQIQAVEESPTQTALAGSESPISEQEETLDPASRPEEAVAAVGFDRPGTVPPPPPPDPVDEATDPEPEDGMLAAHLEGAVPLIPGQDDTQLAIDGIQRAALEKRAERREMFEARAHQAEIEHERAALAAEARKQQAPIKARMLANQREAFRAELLQVLKQGGPTPGAQILALANRYNVEPSPALEQTIARTMKGRGRYYSQDKIRRIALLRGYGLSEPTILGDLIILEFQALSSRQGSRSKDLAIVRAARQLLAVSPSLVTAVASTPRAPVGLPPHRPGRVP